MQVWDEIQVGTCEKGSLMLQVLNNGNPQSYQTYVADETGLFYRVTPNGFLSYKHATPSGSKTAMDR
jgi:hypothetical protein